MSVGKNLLSKYMIISETVKNVHLLFLVVTRGRHLRHDLLFLFSGFQAFAVVASALAVVVVVVVVGRLQPLEEHVQHRDFLHVAPNGRSSGLGPLSSWRRRHKAPASFVVLTKVVVVVIVIAVVDVLVVVLVVLLREKQI